MLKYEGAVPVFWGETLEDHTKASQLVPASLDEEKVQSDQRPTWVTMSENGQPFFWLERGVAEKLFERRVLHSKALLEELAINKVRRIKRK